MPFGVAKATALIQELMNKILPILCRRHVVQELTSRRAQIEAHIDDVCLGTNTHKDHLIFFGAFFNVCQGNHTELKLEKCEFMPETMQYLRCWTLAALKAKPVMDAQVPHEDVKKGLHEVCSFIGACNMYHRQIKHCTHASAIFTDVIKNRSTWRLGPQEQQTFYKIKDQVADAKCLGVPKAPGEIFMVTDVCNVGGGGMLFHSQALEKEECDWAISQ